MLSLMLAMANSFSNCSCSAAIRRQLTGIENSVVTSTKGSYLLDRSNVVSHPFWPGFDRVCLAKHSASS